MKVTADIHVYHATSYQFFNCVIASFFMIKAIFVNVGFWVTFLCIEIAKIAFFILISFGNVSSFLQVAIILDFRKANEFINIRNTPFLFSRFITRFEDNKILLGVKLSVGLMTSILCYDYIGVG